MKWNFVIVLFMLITTKAFCQEVIHIGVSSNFSELSTISFNPFGGYFKDAIELAIEDNKSILEKAKIKIQLQEFDYGTNDLNVIKKVKEAAASKVVAVIGYNYSSNALLAAPIHTQEKLPMISPSATANRLGTFGKYVHLGSFNNEFMAMTLAKIAIKVLKKKRVLILTAVNCAYCVDLGNTFSDEMKKLGGEIIKNVSVIQEDPDFSQIAKEVKKLSFDVVFIPNQELTAARLISSMIEAGIDKPFLGADGWGNEGSEFFRVLKGKSFTGYSVTHWHPKLNTKKSIKFVDDYLKKYQKLPNDTSVLAYDSMSLLIKALTQTKNISREKLNETLSSLKNFEGVTGQFVLKANKAPRKDIIILKTTDTGFAIHKVISPENGDAI
ncbi:MAG: ABC transporter substrate-binding protein [Bacteriovoracia bacterium]